MKIYVGVGHGGSDPGAVSGVHREAAYALDIATACTEELKRHGCQVMQSRTSNATEVLSDKIRECNAYNPDVGLDIHLNAGGGDGFEIFHSIIGGKGKTLAQQIEAAVKSLGQNSRGLKTKKNSNGKDYFGFIQQTNCPAVLVECAFIDSSDAAIVDTLAERQKMGVAIAHGVLKYFGVAVKPQELPSGCFPEFAVLLPQLKCGDEGVAVRRLQTLLNDAGHCGSEGKPLTVDGDFGKNTGAAVKGVQRVIGISADGVVNAKTWRFLITGKR